MRTTTIQSTSDVSPEVADLCDALFGFVRAFGLHRTEETPCGQALSVSEAQALTSLLETSAAPSQLADRLALARSTVSRLLDQMEGRDWIGREPNPVDGRSSVVVLTHAGRLMAERVLTARRRRITELLANINESDRAEVVRSLHLLAEAAHVS